MTHLEDSITARRNILLPTARIYSPQSNQACVVRYARYMFWMSIMVKKTIPHTYP